MTTTLRKPQSKKPKMPAQPNLETVSFEEGIAYLVEKYGMRADDAEHQIAQIKASARRYTPTDE